MLAVFSLAGPTLAQTVTLVDNTGQTTTPVGHILAGGTSGTEISQGFTTGTHAAGYTLASVGVHVANSDLESGETITLYIYDSETNGTPKNLVHTLTTPGSVQGGQVVDFAAPTGATLSANTKYFVVFTSNSDSGDNFAINTAASGNEDSGAATGWSIENTYRLNEVLSEGAAPVKIRIKGEPITPNNAPVFAATTLTRSVAENATAGTNVGDPIPAASDADATDTLTYSMEGTDADSFTFTPATRQIQTKAGVTYDFEAAQNTYAVTIKVDDGNGGSDTVAVTISLTDADEPPSAPAAPTVAPTPGSTTTSLDVSWTAPENAGKPAITGYDLRYCKGASSDCTADGDFSDGPQDVATASSTITGLDPHSEYQVQVRAVNVEGDGAWSPSGSGSTANSAPSFAATTLTFSLAENTAGNVNVGTRITATDADNDNLVYILEGADRFSFNLTPAQQLRTRSGVTYDFEAKPSYTVTIRARDGSGGSDTVAVTINLTDVNEPPSAPARPTVTAPPGSSTSLAVSWTAPANAGKPSITGYDLQYRAGTSGAFTDGPQNVTGTTSTITGLEANTAYQVQVRAVNDEGDGAWSPSGSGTTGNTAPVFADATLTFSVAENTAGSVNVGTTIPAASDADGDTLTYTLEGPDAGSFTLTSARQIRTKAGVTYDFEAKPSYAMRVKADDGKGGTDTVAVTINLTDVNEPPSAPGAPAVTATPGSTTGLSVSWTAPSNAGRPAITDYDLQYRAGTSGAFTDGPQNVTGTSATITGLDPDTEYQVQVRAVNDEGDGAWSPSGSGRTGTAADVSTRVTLSLSRATVREGGGAQALVVTGRLDRNAQAQDVTVTLSAGGGTAEKPGDYAAPDVTLTIPAGRTSARATFTVTPVDDAVDEEDETLVVSGALSSSQSLAVEPSAGLAVTIEDDDTRGATVRPTALTVREGQRGTYTVGLLSQPTAEVTVTATAPSGLTLATGPDPQDTDFAGTQDLTFTASNWASAQTVTVAAADDEDVEADATGAVTHAVSGADYGSVTAAAVSVTVPGHEEDEDGTLRLWIPADGAVTVPGLGGLRVTFPASRAGGTMTVRRATAPGAAPPGFRLGETVVDLGGVTLGAGESATVCLPASEEGEPSVQRWDGTAAEWMERDPPPGGSPEGRACAVTPDLGTFAVMVRLAEPQPVFSEAALTVAAGGEDGARYTVALDAAPAGAVSVSVSAEGPAAPALTVEPARLVFTEADWAQPQAVTVTASEDAEPGEAVLGHEVSGERYRGSWRAELPVAVAEDAGPGAPLRRAWLARFGRTAAGHVAEAVGERLSAAPAERNPGSAATESTLLSGALQALSGEAAPALANASFVLPLAPGGRRNWTAWGRGAYTEFDGEEGELKLDGEVWTGTVGVDWEHGRWRLGLALSHSEGDGEVRADEGGQHDLESTLTGVHPYARWQLRDGLSAWGVLGWGEGELESRENGETSETDIEMQMVAAGLEGPVGEIQSERGTFGLSLKADVLAVRMEADEDAELSEVEADAQRVRVRLEGAGHYGLEAGGQLQPTLEAGVRFDGGDAETGLGAEVGAGLRYADASGRLSAELTVHGLLAHEENDYEEWGVGGSLVLAPDAAGRGLSLRLGSSFGAAGREAGSLWSPPGLAGLAPGESAASAGRFEAELGCGLNGPGGRGTLTPYVGYERGDRDARWRLGARLEVGEGLRLSLEGVHGDESALEMQGALRW